MKVYFYLFLVTFLSTSSYAFPLTYHHSSCTENQCAKKTCSLFGNCLIQIGTKKEIQNKQALTLNYTELVEELINEFQDTTDSQAEEVIDAFIYSKIEIETYKKLRSENFNHQESISLGTLEKVGAADSKIAINLRKFNLEFYEILDLFMEHSLGKIDIHTFTEKLKLGHSKRDALIQSQK